MTKTTNLAVATLGLLSTTTTAADTLFADGGFQTAPVACQSGVWEYKALDKTVSNHEGCISITDFPPYPMAEGAVTPAPLDPTDPATDRTAWCATEERYNPGNELRRESWGYCLTRSDAEEQTTSSPTASSTAADVEPTAAPTADLAPGLYADGGFASTPVECMSSWRFKNKDADEDEAVSGCVSMEDFLPWPYITADEAVIASSGVRNETDGRTSRGMWCSTREVYNPFPENNVENREAWGFCLEVKSEAETGAPTSGTSTTAAPTVTGETPAPTSGTGTAAPTNGAGSTPAPSASGTGAPSSGTGSTVAPTSGTSTAAPTEEGDRPPNSGTAAGVGAGSSDGPSGGAVAGIVIAVLLVCAAVLLAVMYVQSQAKKKKEGADERLQDDVEGQQKRSNVF